MVNTPKKVVHTYTQAFQVLEFLAEAKVIELVGSGDPTQYKIRKLA